MSNAPLPSPLEKPHARVNPERVGIYMDRLAKMIHDLDQDPELEQIFGQPVSRSLVVVADNNDLRIEEGGCVALDEDQTATFMRILDEVIRRNSA